MRQDVNLSVVVNGRLDQRILPARTTLSDYLREELRLTGTRVGCEQGLCGACTVLVDGASVRSCLMLAVQADGAEVRTVESLAEPDGGLSELQRAFADNDALQCGFCTPGVLMASTELLREDHLDEADVREALSGNLCRCTGYQGIVSAVLGIHARCGGAGEQRCWSSQQPDPASLRPDPVRRPVRSSGAREGRAVQLRRAKQTLPPNVIRVAAVAAALMTAAALEWLTRRRQHQVRSTGVVRQK